MSPNETNTVFPIPTGFPEELFGRLARHGQTHLLLDWDKLDSTTRENLLKQIDLVDFDLIDSLWKSRNKTAAGTSNSLEAPQFFDPYLNPSEARSCAEAGHQALSQGKVACVLVAGGQGTRLGATVPKGCLSVGPISGKSLYQYHSERVRALSRKYGVAIPLLVMTSPATHKATLAFFNENNGFGLGPDQLHFFQQGTMPAVDLETGRLLLEAPGRLFASPDGHGGCLAALAGLGWLDWMAKKGIEQIFYFQVDNPLVRIADPIFLGHHLRHNADVSSRFVEKTIASEKVGVFAQTPGNHHGNAPRCALVEYSDLTPEQTEAKAEDGGLLFRCGSPAIHLFSRKFLEEIAPGHARLPFHLARKKVPFVNEKGAPVLPKTENALKFEKFVFDALPLATRWTLVRSLREEEFAPLKNAMGPDSPETVRAGLFARNRAWLAAAYPEESTAGHSSHGDKLAQLEVEISPLLATDPEDLKTQLGTMDLDSVLARAQKGSLHLKATSE
jgi:UDP-N-acetylglucosamine/UDP-N-acetylgalactosamine diphosphorylase